MVIIVVYDPTPESAEEEIDNLYKHTRKCQNTREGYKKRLLSQGLKCRSRKGNMIAKYLLSMDLDHVTNTRKYEFIGAQRIAD